MTDGMHERQLEVESGVRRIVGLNHGDTAPARSSRSSRATPTPSRSRSRG